MRSEPFNQHVAQIEGWMSTYFLPPFDGSGGIGGPIATYWASSPYMAGPYVMNSYGLIRGLCARAGDDYGSQGRLRAEQLALYYLRSQDPTSGIVVCCWGEDPFSGNGLVQQASVVAALWDMYRVWPDPEFARAAQLCWKACLKHPAMRAHWTSHNMALRAGEALILGVRSRGESNPSPKEKALLQRIGRQVEQAQWGQNTAVAGAISQSLSDDDFIMPYQGKCLNPLVMLSKTLFSNIYLEIAIRLADFILKNMEIAGQGHLIAGQYLAEGPDFPEARRLYRWRRLIPLLEPNLRRHRRKMIGRWRFNPWPKWVARGLDTARGLYHLGQTLNEEKYIKAALQMVQESLRFQTPLGGLRNTLGFFGTDPEVTGLVWQDMAAIPRWNSYAVQFLHELAAGTPILQPAQLVDDSQDEVTLLGNLRLQETITELRLTSANGDQIWKLHKGHRWGQPFRPLSKWNEGGPFTGRKVH